MRERKETAVTKTRRFIFLLEFFVFCIAMIVCFLDEGFDIIFVMIIGAAMVILGELAYKLLLITFKEEEERNKSEILVESNLSTEIPLRVVLIKADDEYEEEFFKDLTTRAKFYAIIMEEQVKILIQYNGEQAYIPFKELEKQYFNDYYRVKTTI